MARKDTLTLRLSAIEREDLEGQAKREGRSIGDVARRRLFPRVVELAGEKYVVEDPPPLKGRVKEIVGKTAIIEPILPRPFPLDPSKRSVCSTLGHERFKFTGSPTGWMCRRCGEDV